MSKYLLLDKKTMAFDGFYLKKDDAICAMQRRRNEGANNIMLLEVLHSDGNVGLPDDKFWTRCEGFSE